MNTWRDRLLDALWTTPEAEPRTVRRLRPLARLVFVLVRDAVDGQISMRAMGLVYTTLLSIVPLLALAFSVLKALGVHNTLEPVLIELLRPLGEQSRPIADSVIGFVDNMRVGVLGSLGVALLFYSAVSMIQKVESAFNFIWRIERGRPLSQRLGEYFAVLTIGPVAVFSALGITATLLRSEWAQQITAIEPFGSLVYALTRLLPYLLIIGVFTFLYGFLPNTRVKLRAAFWGALFAGAAWQGASLVFASFVAGAPKYNAIYSGFAIVILLLIWLYVGWLILLLGSQLAFYVQHPEHLKPQRVPSRLSARDSEYLALALMALVGRRFIDGAQAWTQEELCVALDAEPAHVANLVDTLMHHGLLAETGPQADRLQPGRDLDSLSLADVLHAARSGSVAVSTVNLPAAAAARRLVEAAEAHFNASITEPSLRAWILETQLTSVGTGTLHADAATRDADR